MSNNKAQVSILDFIIGMIMIIGAIIIGTTILTTTNNDDTFSKLEYQATTASNILLSQGYPAEWNQTNMIRPGILIENNKRNINTTKLQNLINITNNNYQEIRKKLLDDAQIYVYFKNTSTIINISGNCGFGSTKVTQEPNCTIKFPEHQEFLAIKRLVIINNSVLTMVVNVWH